ncbi:DUF7471 family protein [Halovivax gelatinilyticus]|uniref:DUF7471 family protein n=1 Tax=Halovivax gelatinilyticus TaxID=2961597 RepID=UPI0020CA38F5|nr:hypothetical protein [Halovivax gelatinilyticus]
MIRAMPASWHDPELTPLLLVVIALAAVGTTVLFLAAVVAYRRRRTARYALLSIVLGLLVTRSVVGLGTVFGVVPMTVHHLIEHGFDFLIAALLLWAVYRGGSPERADRTDGG